MESLHAVMQPLGDFALGFNLGLFPLGWLAIHLDSTSKYLKLPPFYQRFTAVLIWAAVSYGLVTLVSALHFLTGIMKDGLNIGYIFLMILVAAYLMFSLEGAPKDSVC
jgi:hypothetical protein